jgi:uncharacterized protein (DUF488 family)
MTGDEAARFYSLGHSTRPLEEFMTLLGNHGVAIVADVRTYPRSRRYPQYDLEAMAASLPAAGVRYVHLLELGGRRRPQPDSSNTGWRNESFRGYADYMATLAFAEALDRLLALGGEGRVAIVCSEAVPWRCHRSMIADALVVRGEEVRHITGAGVARPHRLTPFAHVDGISISYPAPLDAAFGM